MKRDQLIKSYEYTAGNWIVRRGAKEYLERKGIVEAYNAKEAKDKAVKKESMLTVRKVRLK